MPRSGSVRAALLTAVVAAGTTLVWWLQDPASGSAGAGADDEGARSGEQIWLQDCAFCHGPEGGGSFQGPRITDSGTASVDFMVRTGRMPLPYRGQGGSAGGPAAEPGEATYGPEEIDALVAHTARFVDGPSPPEPADLTGGDLARGGELYRLNCAACHQSAGAGGALAYGVVGPPLGGSSRVEVVEAMRTGPGNMPVFSVESFDDRGARDIAAYVEYLGDPRDRGGWALGHIGPVAEGVLAWVVGVLGTILVCRWLGRRRPASDR